MQIVCLNDCVYTDSMTEINTLSPAELSYQSNPCGVLVDMDTVNIAGNTLANSAKGAALCDLPVASANLYILHFSHFADFKHWMQKASVPPSYSALISVDWVTSKSQEYSLVELLNLQGYWVGRR